MSKPSSGLFKKTHGAVTASKQESSSDSKNKNVHVTKDKKTTPVEKQRPEGSYETIHKYPISNEYVPANNKNLIAQCDPISIDKTVAVTTSSITNKPAWLETGSDSAGIKHIMSHESQFADKGIAKKDIPELIMKAVSKGKFIGYSSKSKKAASVYDVSFNKKNIRIAVTISDNGFIVQSNPYSKEKKIWK